MAIRTVAEHVAFENKFLRVYDNEVEFPSGAAGRYLRLVQGGEGTPAVVLAVCAGRVALVRVYRYPLGEHRWELPRGTAHGDALATARAELAEETGAVATTGRVLGHLTPDSGLLATRVAVVYAECAEVGAGPTDLDEVAAVRWVPIAELRDLLVRGELEDGFTLAAYGLAAAQGLL